MGSRKRKYASNNIVEKEGVSKKINAFLDKLKDKFQFHLKFRMDIETWVLIPTVVIQSTRSSRNCRWINVMIPWLIFNLEFELDIY